MLGEFLAQFYDDKPCPRCILLSHEVGGTRLARRSAGDQERPTRSRSSFPGAARSKRAHRPRAANAREALGRKLADSARSSGCSPALATTFGLPRPPRRIEVYDNSHIQGTNAVGAMIVAGPEGFRKNQYRKFNIRSTTSPRVMITA